MPTETSIKREMGSRVNETYTNGILTGKSSSAVSRVSTDLTIVKPTRRKKPAPPLTATPYTYSRTHKQYPRGIALRRLASSNSIANVYRGDLLSALGVVWSDMRGPGTWSETENPGADIVSMAQTGALNKLLTQESDHTRRDGNIDLGVAWRERNELGGLYRDAASRIGKSRDAILDLNFDSFARLSQGRMSSREARNRFKRSVGGFSKKFLRAPGAFANGWLALKLGYLPVLQDLHAAAEALAFSKLEHDWDIHVKHRVKRVDHKTDFGRIAGTTHTAPLTKYWQQLTKSAEVGMTGFVVDELAHRLAQFGLNNPASILYESAPLTFIADYFVDLGSWLKSLGAAYGMEFRSGYTTEYVEWLATNTDDGTDPAANWYGQARTVKWERKIMNAWPFPIAPLAIKPGGLNLSQITTVSAVMYAKFMPRMGRGKDFSQKTDFHRYTD